MTKIFQTPHYPKPSSKVPVSEYRRVGEVSFQHPEAGLEKHRALVTWGEPAGGEGS